MNPLGRMHDIQSTKKEKKRNSKGTWFPAFLPH